MEFVGPEASDYENVRSLNRAFLELSANDRPGFRASDGIPRKHLQRIRSLSKQQTERLAMAPFLLFSLRERDDDYWLQLLGASPERDLFANPPDPADEYGRLVCAGLGFAWQLARKNQYAARLICGASLHWCELIAEQTFFRLLALAGLRSDLLIPRFANDHDLWSKLLLAGVARENDVREAAQLAALQSVLTRPASIPQTKWATAACARQAPQLCVADDPPDQ